METSQDPLVSARIEADDQHPHDIFGRIDQERNKYVLRWIVGVSGGPYNDGNNFYRVDLPLEEIRTLIEAAMQIGTMIAEQVMGQWQEEFHLFDEFNDPPDSYYMTGRRPSDKAWPADPRMKLTPQPMSLTFIPETDKVRIRFGRLPITTEETKA